MYTPGAISGTVAAMVTVPNYPRDPRDRNPNNYDYMKLIRTRKAAIMQKYSLYCQKDLSTSYKKLMGIEDLAHSKDSL